MGGCHDALEIYWVPKLRTVYLCSYGVLNEDCPLCSEGYVKLCLEKTKSALCAYALHLVSRAFHCNRAKLLIKFH